MGRSLGLKVGDRNIKMRSLVELVRCGIHKILRWVDPDNNIQQHDSTHWHIQLATHPFTASFLCLQTTPSPPLLTRRHTSTRPFSVFLEKCSVYRWFSGVGHALGPVSELSVSDSWGIPSTPVFFSVLPSWAPPWTGGQYKQVGVVLLVYCF